MSQHFGLIGVPSSAGAHWPGQEKAPEVLRKAGIVEHLRSVGCSVIDHGDLDRVRSRKDRVQRHPQNLAAVTSVARNVAGQVEMALCSGEIPLVIGGDCTITLGVISGFLHASVDPALLYFDGGVDLRTPATNPTGILDSMGMAHMLGQQGTAEELSHIGPRFPLLSDEAIALFGYAPNSDDVKGTEQLVLEERSLQRYPLERVQGKAKQTAAEALAHIEKQARSFVIHFDVDVIDFVDFPIADVPQFNVGLTFEEAMECLTVFTSSPQFAGLVITEFNPDHIDEESTLATTFVQGIAHALTQHTIGG